MDEFPMHGTFSSPSNARLDKLAQLVARPQFVPLLKNLGPDAKTCLVGGGVRDVLAGQENVDVDLAVRLTPQEVSVRLTSANIRVIDTGLKHGTVTALCNNENVEITTFRKAGPHGPKGAEGFAQTIEEDLSARDFTINAMAFEIETGRLVDPYGGWRDLENNLVRAVGDPTLRFSEDYLRIMRMVRFGPAQGRDIDEATFIAAKKLCSHITSVAVERIKSELEKILLSEFPDTALRSFLHVGLLEHLLPEFLPSVGFEQNEFHTQDVFEHILTVVRRSPPELTVRLAALFHDTGKPATLSIGDDRRRHFFNHEDLSAEITETVMRRLKFPNDLTASVRSIVRCHMRPIQCGPAGIRRIIRDLDSDFDDWKKLKRADATPTVDTATVDKEFEVFDQAVETEKNRKVGSPFSHLAIDGNDLIALGVKPGVRLGQILKALGEVVIEEPEANVREILLEKARRLIAENA